MTAQPLAQHPGYPLNQAEAAVSALPLPPVQNQYAVNASQTYLFLHMTVALKRQLSWQFTVCM